VVLAKLLHSYMLSTSASHNTLTILCEGPLFR